KEMIDQAIELNPVAPDDYLWISGSAEFFTGNYERSYRQLSRMSDHLMVDRLMAASAAMMGDLEKARTHRISWMSRYPDFRIKDYAAFVPHARSADVEHFVD